jgi:hypothetical protein
LLYPGARLTVRKERCRMPARNHIDLVDKTLRVIEVLAESDEGYNLKTIATRVRMVFL